MHKKINFFLKLKIDAILINSPANLRYFIDADMEGALLITQNEMFLFTDSRYLEIANNFRKFKIIDVSNKGKIETIKLKILNEKFLKIGVEADYLCHLDYCKIFKNSGLVSVDVSKELGEIRMTKEEFEIKRMKNAQNISEHALESTLPFIKKGATEIEIAAKLEYKMRMLGSEGTSFPTIVVSGKRSSLPHGVPTLKKLENGDFVTIDFGCIYEGYSSDMTRTFVIGKANEQQRKIYDIVKRAQNAAVEKIAEGVRCKDIDDIARDIISKNGYQEYFKHSIGHGVGVLVHELPLLSKENFSFLKKNMIVTVEPGIYIPGFGGVRIEDMILVNDSGHENLNSFTKELIEID